MNELEVDCVQRAHARAPHWQISHLGHRGFACRMPVELAITRIMGRVDRFYTLDPATLARIYIGVRRESGRCPYLQAQVGGDWTDHLLVLPECARGYRVIRDGVMSDARCNRRFLVPR